MPPDPRLAGPVLRRRAQACADDEDVAVGRPRAGRLRRPRDRLGRARPPRRATWRVRARRAGRERHGTAATRKAAGDAAPRGVHVHEPHRRDGRRWSLVDRAPRAARSAGLLGCHGGACPSGRSRSAARPPASTLGSRPRSPATRSRARSRRAQPGRSVRIQIRTKRTCSTPPPNGPTICTDEYATVARAPLDAAGTAFVAANARIVPGVYTAALSVADQRADPDAYSGRSPEVVVGGSAGDASRSSSSCVRVSPATRRAAWR